MASLEYQEYRWSASTTDADGDLHMEVYGPDPLVAMSELVEAVVVEMGERDEAHRKRLAERDARIDALCERIDNLSPAPATSAVRGGDF